MIEQDVADRVVAPLGFAERIKVAHDGLARFDYAKGVSKDALAFDSGKAGERAAVEIAEQQIGGLAIIPAQAGLPAFRFFGEQRT